MTLQEQLIAYRDHPDNQLPKEVQAVLDSYIIKLRTSNIGKGLGIGSQAPDFPLDHNLVFSQTDTANLLKPYTRLYDLLDTGPVVLTFYRGQWCNYCNLQLKAYESIYDQLKGHKTSLIAISLQSQGTIASFIRENNFSYPILSDEKGIISRTYNLLYELDEDLEDVYKSLGVDLSRENRDHKWHLPVTATLIIDQQGLIIHSFLDTDYKNRMDPKDILSIIDVIT